MTQGAFINNIVSLYYTPEHEELAGITFIREAVEYFNNSAECHNAHMSPVQLLFTFAVHVQHINERG